MAGSGQLLPWAGYGLGRRRCGSPSPVVLLGGRPRRLACVGLGVCRRCVLKLLASSLMPQVRGGGVVNIIPRDGISDFMGNLGCRFAQPSKACSYHLPLGLKRDLQARASHIKPDHYVWCVLLIVHDWNIRPCHVVD